MAKFALLLALIVYSNLLALAANSKITDDQLTIECEHLDASAGQSTLKATDNVVLGFKKYFLHTESLTINFVITNGKKAIATAHAPSKVVLIDKENADDIAVADSASYSKNAAELVLKGNVKIMKNGSLAVVDEFVYSLKK